MKNKLTLSQKLVILMIIINMFFVIKDRFFGISNSSTILYYISSYRLGFSHKRYLFGKKIIKSSKRREKIIDDCHT